MRLLVISHTPHYQKDGQVVGWGPTIRELDYLSQLFDEIIHLAPLYSEEAPASALAHQSPKIHFHPVRPSGGERLSDKLAILFRYPSYAISILKELHKADMVHVRCPANISLLAIMLLALVKKPIYRWAKYAGNWQPAGKEPWSYKLQRWWLQKALHKGIVTVNGRWPDQPKHVYSFPNPSLSSDELRTGQLISRHKNLKQPVQLLFIGRLEKAKGASRVLEIAGLLDSCGVDFRLKMIGDGPDRQDCKNLINRLTLREKVELLGWLPKSELSDHYSRAHFLLLPSTASEGWPKVLSEGMAYGVVPLAGAVSSIPQILAESKAGLAIHPHRLQDYVNAIQDFLAYPDKWKKASSQGVMYASHFSYQSYLEKVRETFQIAWEYNIPISTLTDNIQ